MTLCELLLRAAERFPSRRLIVHGGRALSLPSLRDEARAAAGGALAAGVRPGEPVLLLVSDIEDFFVAFWGTLWAGAIPVPLAAPRAASAAEVERISRVWRQLEGPILVDRGVSLPVPSHDVGAWRKGTPLEGPVSSHGPALIQYSSGSTREPHGVVLTHENLLANIRQIAAVVPASPDDVSLTWMPHFHDMGLIGCHLLPLLVGMEQVRMDAAHAMRDPLRWLEAVAVHRATVLTTTNFALARVNARLAGRTPPELSSVRLILNGAEPISAAVCREFSRLTGLPERVHLPVYGLAEASVAVSCPREPGLVTVQLEGRELAACGEPLPDLEVRLIDGELQVRGPNVTSGYWRDPEATAALRDGEWIRTGDLGAVVDGRLVIAGRRKDVIVVNGRNLHAYDVEAIAEAVPGVRPGGAVAIADHRGEAEALAVAVVVDKGAVAAPVLWAVRRALVAELGVEPSVVVPLPAVPRTTSGKKRRSALRSELESGALDEAIGNTLDVVRAAFAEVLEPPLDGDALDRPLGELGLTSLRAVEALARLEQRLGVLPDHRLLLRGGSVRGMARLLEQEPPPSDTLSSPRLAEPVAIVAAACRLPGADTPEAFWENLRAGRTHLGRAPDGRADDVGGWIDDVDRFDAARFGIPAEEAAAMDPQQRLMLTLAAEALARAGNPDARSTGVFVGAGQQAYQEVVLEHLGEELPPGTLAGNLLSMLAARIAHQLDFRGPALTVDTACSASLVAVHLACQSLRAGECTVALAGGVSLNLRPTPFTLLRAAGALSPSGRCRPFAEDADGIVPGEGAALLVLMPLSEARAQGRPILGIIRGTAINNDGASLGVMAPNPAGQEWVIRRALASAAVDPRQVVFVEAHGTGTRVGDAVESAALRRCYPHGPRIGAVKANIGHLMTAASVAGLLRLLGELRSGELGAVSGFGFGGTNAHAIIEGPPADAPRPTEVAPIEGSRHWLGEADGSGWVHQVETDPAGGLIWKSLPEGPPRLRPGGRYLLTGGLGALGRVVAQHLLRRHQARLVLIGRSALESVAGPLAELRRWGEVEYVQADVTDPGCLDRLRGHFDGGFHLAGTLGPDAMRVKRDGFLHLERLDVGFWALFSSISAVIPGLDRGLGEYAAANAWLIEAATSRRSRGREVTAISWGPWAGGGMAGPFAEALRARGLEPVPPRIAVAALERALSAGVAHVVVLRRPRELGAPRPLPGNQAAQVRAMVARAAGVADVDPDATLGSLGIDSIAALDMVKELERLVGRGLPTTLLYEHDTVTKLVRALEGGIVRHDAPAPVPRTGVNPLLPAQQTFVVQRRFFPDMPGNVLLACTVSPSLERGALERALAAIVERHPVLSAVIRDGQQVEGVSPPTVRWVDALDEDALANEPFDLENGPLERLITDGRRLVLNGHHAIVDAWSQKLVLEDLLATVDALRSGRPLPFTPLGASFAEVAAALSRRPQGSLDWWRERLDGGVPPLHLPWDAPVDVPSHGGAGSIRHVLDAASTGALFERARGAGVTLPAMVLAAWMERLFAWSGQHDVTVRVAHARREARVPDIERVVGSFADSLPVRVSVGLAEPLEPLARRVQAELAQVQQHAETSSMALATLGEHGPAGPVGLTPVGFSFPLLPATAQIGGFHLSEVHGSSGSGFTRLALIAWVFDGRLHLSLCFARSHLREDEVRRMAEDLRARLTHPEPEAAPWLHRRVLERCRSHPDRLAVGPLTYGALARRSAALATRLDAAVPCGDARGLRIAVLASQSPEAVVALLAVLRTGSAYVPLDPEWPDARIRQILGAARPAALVTLPALVDRAAHFELPVVAIGTEEQETGPDREGATAYVMYTSGSTGRPKGVVVSHRACLVFQDWVTRVFGVTDQDRFVGTSSLGYGGSVRQVFTPLLNGGTTHPVPRDIARDPDALVAFLERERITIWNSVPSMWVHLMDAAERSPAPEPFETVRWVLIGGEAVPADQVRRWRARFPGRVVNLYGSTETIVNATFFEAVRDPAPDDLYTPIGWPRAGVSVHLLDEQDGVGELAVGGAIADGYWDEPELTAAAFLEHPVHGRLYRTGDLARRRPDGAFVYLGRRDSQVQVHGNRVELGEIEHLLARHPEVRHAAVVYESGWLVATVEPKPGHHPTNLRAWLAERLPAYMVPHRLQLVDALPLNPAGKADRRRIRQQLRAGTLADHVAGIWMEVLQLAEPPGPEDDFFALGGDSIRVLEVVDRLRPVLGRELRPHTVYLNRRLSALLAALERESPGRGAVASSAPPASGGLFPLSHVQRGFYTAHHRRPEHPPTWCASIPVHGRVEPDALREALAVLIERHEQLRTVFRPGPVQEVLPSLTVPLQFDDLSALPSAVRERALEARWEEELSARFELEHGPLLRVRLCRLAPERHTLVLSAHHIVSDAWSLWVLAGELAQLLAPGGTRTPLPPLAVGYRDVVASERAAGDDPWWRTALAGLAQGAAPCGEPQVSEHFSLPPEALRALSEQARAWACTPYVLVLGLLFDALRELTGEEDLVVATALAGRDSASDATARLIGAFARGLPVRVTGQPTFERVRASFEASLAHADASPSSIAAAVGGAEALERLGRYFFTWLDPSALPLPSGSITFDWPGARFRFATASTATEAMVGVLAHEGLHLHLHGGELIRRLRPALERRLRAFAPAEAALIVYAPEGMPLPIAAPTVIERVTTRLGSSELVLLPGGLEGDLEAAVRAAAGVTRARVVSLAGMLPARTGLGTRPLVREGQVLTTGHAATVVAMVLTVQRILQETGRRWRDERVGVLGYGAIGRAVLELALDMLGAPRELRIDDPRHPERRPVTDATLVLGATSGGTALDVGALCPGTIVVDDSFPRCFDDEAALHRMQQRGDMLLVGGGMIDAGPLERRSPFPDAEAIRAHYPVAWMPGCQAEAVLLAADPSLGPTVGLVTVQRARKVWAAVERAGWTAAPLHLGTWLVPEPLARALPPPGR